MYKTRAILTASGLIFSTLCMASCGSKQSDPVMAAEDLIMMDTEMSGAQNMAPNMKIASGQISQSRPAPSPPQEPFAENPSDLSFMAYSYDYSFSLPKQNVAETAQSHKELCLAAGPRKCQILNASTQTQNSDHIYANIQLRAEPVWLDGFAQDIQASIKKAKGKQTQASTRAEDLTRSILDVSARLKAKKTLRSRLEQHLETRDAKLPDLLALEREYARVQAEIESATTNLNVLKKRVSMSVVRLNYQSQSVAVSPNTVSPITTALKNFIRVIAQGIGNIISVFAIFLPWIILVILPGLWIARRLWRQYKGGS